MAEVGMKYDRSRAEVGPTCGRSRTEVRLKYVGLKWCCSGGEVGLE